MSFMRSSSSIGTSRSFAATPSRPSPVSQAQINAAISNGATVTRAEVPRVGRAPSPERVEAEFLRQHRAPLALGSAISSERARWYVVAAATMREYQVLELLRRDGFEMWLPERIEVQDQPNDRRVMKKPMRRKAPLLPGYLLARFDLTDTTWHRIIGTKYVEGLLGSANRPIYLRDHDIEKLHALIRKYGGIVELRADGSIKRDWIAGEAIEILNDALAAGPWAGKSGQYVGVEDDGRIKIKLDILGRPQVLPFHEALVVPASS